LLIVSPEALIQRVPGPIRWANSSLRLRKHDTFKEDVVRQFLEGAGYSLDERVEIPGSALFLGQMLYPAGAIGPVRLEYSNDKVLETTAYDPASQRRLAEIDELVLDVTSEWVERPTCDADGSKPMQPDVSTMDSVVLDYAPSARIIADFGVRTRARSWIQQIDEASFEESPRAARQKYLTMEEWEAYLRKRKAKLLPEYAPFEQVPRFAGSASPGGSFRKFVEGQQAHGRHVVLTAATERDLRTMDRRAGCQSLRCHSWRDVAKAECADRRSLLVDLDRGFVDGRRKVALITAQDLLGSRASRQQPVMSSVASKVDSATDLAPRDAVIHFNRGLAVLHGLETVSAPGITDHEMLRLEFANNSVVFAPISELRSIWRYSSDPTAVTLDKADGSSWEKRRVEVEREIAETALHIINIAADRKKREAAKIIAPAAEYERFAARFPYFPTSDQSKAIDDVLQDLASGHPMDRLVSGDVGYGKTEVALRAAAAAVFGGKQVAVAVPTTILARQHFETFRRRFKPFGIEIGHLSRFSTAAASRSIKKRLAEGTLRIVVGTHALAGNGVRFNDLGLLIIDEEQRFGQAQKAKLAQLADGLHLLTMTATPIPRTLSQVYAGLCSVSTIATPPVRRVAVKTVVEPFQETAVARVLRRESRRGGQSFFVCPRIEDIGPMEGRLKTLVPELKITVVHGKLPAGDIDEAMMSFANLKSDVLLTTNIVESGLDLPRVNTIVVWRSDRFGLAQLHQLRGRVGRGAAQGFALFLTDPDAPPSPTAERRLSTLSELSGAAAGFAISSGDMDLRGAGDLLSERQSGHVKLLGPALFRHLLERSLRSARPSEEPVGVRPTLHLEVPAALPKHYIQDDATRLDTYARLSKCDSESELDETETEMEERFGELPPEARDFIEMMRIELDCQRLGIVAVDAGPDSIAVSFTEHSRRKTGALRDPLHWKKGRLLYKRCGTGPDASAAVRELLDILQSQLQESAK
jgi:transcription-repair coupling factor (superfamily II helicase)